MTIVGLDAGRDAHRYLIVDAAKNQLDGGVLPNQTWAFEAWAARVEEFGPAIRMIVESGNGLSTPIEQFSLARGWDVVPLSANAVRSYRENVLGLHDKTDESDAEAIALLGIDARARLSARLQPRRELRRLVRERVKLVKEGTRIRNRLRQAIAEVWPELTSKVVPAIVTRSVIWLFANHPDPRELAQLGVENLQLLAKAARVKPSKSFLEKLVSLAQGYQCTVPVEEARLLFAEIRLLGRRLQHVLDDIDSLEALVKERTANDASVNVLVTIPGCGDVLATAIMAEIQDIRNFESEAKLASYAGLALKKHQTGKTANYKLPQLHANRRLKRAVLLLAMLSGKYSHRSAAYLAKKCEEGKKPLQAQRSLARHFVRLIHSMLRTLTPYKAT